MEIISKRWNDFDVLEITGRIDGLTSAALKRSIDQAAVDGRRRLILDFTQVSYMSSAGLRVMLQSHKSLKQIGGELTMVSVPPAVMEVFTISGMAGFLQILPDLDSLLQLNKPMESAEVMQINLDGISFEWRKGSPNDGKLFTFGSDNKLHQATFCPEDQVKFKPSEIAFGIGLGALGEDYSDYESLFGEAVIIQHHFFSFPAVSRPVVDYTYFSPEAQHSLNFLYGFGMNGEFTRVMRFDVNHEPLSIRVLLNAACKLTGSKLFGVVILGISGGIHGMHLKKSPVIENQLSSGTIFDTAHFPHWMNFSIESEEINKTIVASGIFVNNDDIKDPLLKKILPETGNMHLHAAVFENGLWSNNIMEFEDELQRVVRDFEPQKVLHLLPDSKLKSGYIAIINIASD